MRKIENNLEFDEAIKLETIVIADFYADWCGPCQAQLPILEDLSKDYDGRVDFIKINVEHQPELAQRFSVRSIPTIIFFKNKNAVDTKVGLQSKDELQNMITALEFQTN